VTSGNARSDATLVPVSPESSPWIERSGAADFDDRSVVRPR